MPDTLDQDLVILGMGVGGLTAAIEAAKKGKKVIIFDKRSIFSRTQSVVLSDDSLGYLAQESNLMRRATAAHKARGTDILDSSDKCSAIIGNLKGSIASAADKEQIKKLINAAVDEYFVCLMDGPASSKTANAIAIEQGISADELKSLLHDIKISIATDIKENKTQINQIQQILYNRIQFDPDLKALITIEDNISGDYNIDTTAHTISYTKNSGERSTKAFSHLIDATGTSRVSERLLSGYTDDEERSFVNTVLSAQPRHTTSGTVHLKVPVESHILLDEDIRPFNFSDMDKLRAVGWMKPYLPNVYILPDATGTKIYIAGEVPDSFLGKRGVEKEAAMLAWGKVIMEIRCNIPQDKVSLNIADLSSPKYDAEPSKKKVAEAKNKLRTTVFPLILSSESSCHVSLSDKTHVIMIGDSSRNSDFRLGIGANDAILDAIKLIANMQDDFSIDLDGFEQQFKDKVDRMLKGTSIQNARLSSKDRIQFQSRLGLIVKNIIKLIPDDSSDEILILKQQILNLLNEASNAIKDKSISSEEAKILYFTKLSLAYNKSLELIDTLVLTRKIRIASDIEQSTKVLHNMHLGIKGSVTEEAKKKLLHAGAILKNATKISQEFAALEAKKMELKQYSTKLDSFLSYTKGTCAAMAAVPQISGTINIDEVDKEQRDKIRKIGYDINSLVMLKNELASISLEGLNADTLESIRAVEREQNALVERAVPQGLGAAARVMYNDHLDSKNKEFKEQLAKTHNTLLAACEKLKRDSTDTIKQLDEKIQRKKDQLESLSLPDEEIQKLKEYRNRLIMKKYIMSKNQIAAIDILDNSIRNARNTFMAEMMDVSTAIATMTAPSSTVATAPSPTVAETELPSRPAPMLLTNAPTQRPPATSTSVPTLATPNPSTTHRGTPR